MLEEYPRPAAAVQSVFTVQFERNSYRGKMSCFAAPKFSRSVLVIAICSLLVFGNDARILGSSQPSQSPSSQVNVTVYFETLCSDSIRFFGTELQRAARNLPDIMNLKFVPFGKAQATPKISDDGKVEIEFSCQHGPMECYGNKVMSCAQLFLAPRRQWQFFTCMMAKKYPATAGPECAKDLGINWDHISKCSSSPLGNLLLYINGRKTASLFPRLRFVPTVTIAGPGGSSQYLPISPSSSELSKKICRAYGAAHIICDVMLSR